MVILLNIDVSKLNEIDILIYKYILNNGNKVGYMTIRELAGELHMSTTTILRFCKKAGFDGFTELKLNLKMKQEKKEIKTTIGEIDVLDEFIKNVPMINLAIKNLAKIILDKKMVLFIGTGSSGTIADYGAKYMSHFNKFAFSINDPYYPFNQEVIEDGIAIILSVSGESKVMIEVCEKLKVKGVKTISITNKKTSTLARLTDYSINYYVSQESCICRESNVLEYSDMTSQLPSVYIVENLAKEVGKLSKNKN